MNQQSTATGIELPTRGLQSAVCFLLVSLLIYNPFIALLHSHTGLTLHHPPRNRATVGSSELQHFTPVGKNVKSTTALAVSLGDIVSRLVKLESSLPGEDSVAPAVLQEFSANLWFRPPPAA